MKHTVQMVWNYIHVVWLYFILENMKCLIFIFLGGKIVAPLKSNGLNKKNVHFLVFNGVVYSFW